MRVRTAWAALLVVMAGCLAQPGGTWAVDGFPTDAPFSIDLTSAGGIVVWNVTNRANVSLGLLRLDAQSREDAVAVIAAALLLPGEGLVVPGLIKDHNRLADPPSNEVAVGDVRVPPTSARGAAMRHEGAQSVFVDGEQALFVVAWSGVSNGTLTAHWHRGTSVEERFRGSGVIGFTSANMSGGARLATTSPSAGADVDRSIRFDQAPAWFGVIEAPGAAADGTVTVTDSEGDRAASLVVDAFRLRTTFTSVGATTLTLRSDNAPQVVGLAAPVPAEIFGREWAETLANN